MNASVFTPLPVGTTSLTNRIAFTAPRTSFARGGRLNDQYTAYYRRRARVRRNAGQEAHEKVSLKVGRR